MKKKITVTSFDDVTYILLTQIKGRYKRKHAWDQGVLSLLIFGPFGSFPSWFIWEATDPLIQLPWCLLRSGTITRWGSVLYLFNCTCPRLSQASWVSVFQLFASQLGISPPCIFLTQYQKDKDHNPLEWNSAHGINRSLGEPTTSIQHSQRVTYRLTTFAYICQSTSNCNIRFTCYNQIYARNKHAHQCWEMYVHIRATYVVTGNTHITNVQSHYHY